MALGKPTPVSVTKPIRDEVLRLAWDFARIKVAAELTKFRFKFGGLLIFLSVVIFFAGESLEVGRHFRPDFPDRAWFVSKAVFLVGLAFAGKEVVEAVISGVKNLMPKIAEKKGS